MHTVDRVTLVRLPSGVPVETTIYERMAVRLLAETSDTGTECGERNSGKRRVAATCEEIPSIARKATMTAGQTLVGIAERLDG